MMLEELEGKIKAVESHEELDKIITELRKKNISTKDFIDLSMTIAEKNVELSTGN